MLLIENCNLAKSDLSEANFQVFQAALQMPLSWVVNFKLKYMKKLFKYFLICLSFILVYFIYNISFSERALKAKENEKNIKQIKLGMKKYEVLQIMGKPDNISTNLIKTNVVTYYYKPSFGNFEGIYIELEDDFDVIEVTK